MSKSTSESAFGQGPLKDSSSPLPAAVQNHAGLRHYFNLLARPGFGEKMAHLANHMAKHPAQSMTGSEMSDETAESPAPFQVQDDDSLRDTANNFEGTRRCRHHQPQHSKACRVAATSLSELPPLDIETVKNIHVDIEACLWKGLARDTACVLLVNERGYHPLAVCLVWAGLEKANPEFFKTYQPNQ